MKKKLKNFSVKKKSPKLPETYSADESEVVEAHISKYFGEFENVAHEIVSPDIHVDIAIIPPTQERHYYTLVTMGMGAHRMNVPKELAEHKLERAEMLICLPAHWELDNLSAEEWYWPLRWLKVMARLPIQHDTWLGWGHTVPNGEPFAGNTKLSGMIVSSPVQFSEESFVCKQPDGSQILFYQLIPLYDEEMNYKREYSAESLFYKMTEEMMSVVDINRPNVML